MVLTDMYSRRRHIRFPVSFPVIATCMLLLVACGGGYQAPMLEQGERQAVSEPIIVDSSTPESSFRIDNSPVKILSSRSEDGSASNMRSSNAESQSSRSQATPNRAVSAASKQQSTTNSNRSGPISHRVRPGDTLFSIAFQYDLDFRQLAIANSLNPPYTIFVGREINLNLDTVVGANSSLSNLGTAVGNNSVARARGTNTRPGAVMRQPVTRTPRAVNWQWPHQGKVIRGFRSGVSKGLDIAGNIGDPVLAAGDGDVVYSGRGIQGTGDLIIIRHSDRYLSAYAHNSRMLVSEGSRVRGGEKIAEVGENSSGVAMLHFEIREAGDSVNPSRLLPSR